MRKNIFICFSFVLFTFQYVTAQIISGKVWYDVNMEDFYEGGIKDGKATPELKRMFRMTADAAKNIQLELIFNKGQSIFQHQKGLSISDIDMLDDFVKSLASKGTYYTDLIEGIQLLQTSYDGKEYSVKSKIYKLDWTLTKEQKQIGRFLCYKAVLDKSIAGKNHKIIAWYAPKIPFSFGPVDYVGNLPGLILELIIPGTTYTASKIEIDPKKEVTIDWPKDIKTMTEEEYKKEGDKVKAQLDRGW